MKLYWERESSTNIMTGKYGARYFPISLRISVIAVAINNKTVRMYIKSASNISRK